MHTHYISYHLVKLAGKLGISVLGLLTFLSFVNDKKCILITQ